MPTLFNRHRTPDVTPALEVVTGVICAAPGCAKETAVRCAYRDRRERQCTAQFCAAHSVILDGVAYCRRHAGTVQAIGDLATQMVGRPDVDDRKPSLVNWIARDLDSTIREMLTRAMRPGEKVLADSVVRLTRNGLRRVRWERSWRIVDHTGVVLKVVIHMSEDDEGVHVGVGNELAADAVPPWIARRRGDADVEAAIDISQRERFYRFLEENISEAVARFRTHADRVEVTK